MSVVGSFSLSSPSKHHGSSGDTLISVSGLIGLNTVGRLSFDWISIYTTDGLFICHHCVFQIRVHSLAKSQCSYSRIKNVNLNQLYLNTGEGDGSPLQYSCLENPMDGGAW